MAELWSPEHKVVLERRLWVAVLRAQRDLGLDIPADAIDDHVAVIDKVDLASIDARERVTKHDVKARIEEFSALAGHEHIHAGMTSRDLTENVEQLQVRAALVLVRDRMVAALARLADRAAEHATLVMTGRSHNVAAQATTMGKRFANAGEELLQALRRVEELLDRYPLRGIKGPVGTQQDMLDLLGGADRVAQLEAAVATHLGFEATLTNVGQVYPRSLDLDVVAALVQAAAGPASLATTIRLMAGLELATEGFQPGQVGSSAMPHKMNSRSCERINGLAVVLRGHLSMVGELAGDQWNEGDVSCSVVRRVALPDAFLAADGLFETFLVGARRLRCLPGRHRSGARPLPAVPHHHEGADGRGACRGRSRGGPRGHQGARRGGGAGHARARRSAERPARPARGRSVACRSTGQPSTALVGEPLGFVGTAVAQVGAFVAQVEEVVARHPDAAAYRPEPIL